ncbi:MAG: hypothetical protein NXH75_10745 [Halobacteriovoraceae bacterium]|nr:hypothetical protein [Halobacteriovoraceae bacterium]
MAMDVYCFKRSQSLDQIKSYLQTVTAPKDKIFKRESTHCLEIKISSNRKDLLEKWMYKKYRPLKNYNESRGTNMPATSTQPRSGTCRLKIETISSGNANTETYAVGKRNTVNKTNTKSSGRKVSSLLLGVGFSGYITVNDEKAELKCQSVGGAGYRVALSVQGGQNGIGTNLQVRKGQKLNIGDIVNDLKRKRKSIGLSKGVEVESTKGSEKTTYFLTAE